MIESNVVQCHAVRGNFRRLHYAPTLTARTTHLEDVREIGIEGNLDGEAPRTLVEIAHGQSLEAGRVPQQPRPANMDEIVRKVYPALPKH